MHFLFLGRTEVYLGTEETRNSAAQLGMSRSCPEAAPPRGVTTVTDEPLVSCSRCFYRPGTPSAALTLHTSAAWHSTGNLLRNRGPSAPSWVSGTGVFQIWESAWILKYLQTLPTGTLHLKIQNLKCSKPETFWASKVLRSAF